MKNHINIINTKERRKTSRFYNFFHKILEEENMENRLYFYIFFLVSFFLFVEGIIAIIISPADILQYSVLFSLSLILLVFIYVSKKKRKYYTFTLNIILLLMLCYLFFPSGGLDGTTMLFLIFSLTLSWLMLGKYKLKIITSSVAHILAFIFMLIIEFYDKDLHLLSKYENHEIRVIMWFFEGIIVISMIIIFMHERVKQDSIYIKSIEKRLERASKIERIDELTKAYTRKYTIQLISNHIYFSSIDNSRHSLVFFDIDGFKSINDNFGHSTGDEVLKEMIEFFKKNLRESDFIGRYAGDEFIILLPNTNINDGFIRIDNLRNSISKARWTSKNLIVTISVGISEISSMGRDMMIYKNYIINSKNFDTINDEDYDGLYSNSEEIVKSIIKDADNKMYIAKKQGRNKVIK